MSSERDERAELHERVLLKLDVVRDANGLWEFPGDTGTFRYATDRALATSFGIVQMLEWLGRGGGSLLITYPIGLDTKVWVHRLSPTDVNASGSTLADALAQAADAVEEPS